MSILRLRALKISNHVTSTNRKKLHKYNKLSVGVDEFIDQLTTIDREVRVENSKTDT